MENDQSKRRNIVTADLLQEKVRNLPLLCVESICKFTPTSKLVRLYSNTHPLPGAFWNFGLQTVLQKRLPLSLVADQPNQQADNPPELFDTLGAKVASVQRPEAFRFSPLREFVDSATLTVHVARQKKSDAPQLYALHGNAMLSQLPKLKALSLFVTYSYWPFEQKKDLLVPNVNHLWPLLESFVIKRSKSNYSDNLVDPLLGKLVRTMPVHRMLSLRRLHWPDATFRCAMEKSISRNPCARLLLPGLNSFGSNEIRCWRNDESDPEPMDVLRFVATNSRPQLSVLSVFVCGEFKPYLDAFRALTGLRTLIMNVDLSTLQCNGLLFDGSETINSVSDLRIIAHRPPYASLCAVASFFPNVKAAALQSSFRDDPLQLPSVFCEGNVLAMDQLSCFFPDLSIGEFTSCDRLVHFLASPNLPETVDFSQLRCAKLAYYPPYLVFICREMRRNSMKTLLLRGPVHREAVSRLLRQADLSGEHVKVCAWKDRDLGDQPGIWKLAEISEQTDFKILGMKTAGSLKGEQFAVRVFHQLAKQVDIFD